MQPIQNRVGVGSPPWMLLLGCSIVLFVLVGFIEANKSRIYLNPSSNNPGTKHLANIIPFRVLTGRFNLLRQARRMKNNSSCGASCSSGYLDDVRLTNLSQKNTRLKMPRDKPHFLLNSSLHLKNRRAGRAANFSVSCAPTGFLPQRPLWLR